MNLKILSLVVILTVLLISGCTTDKGGTGELIQKPDTSEVVQQEPECVPEWQCSEWSKCSPQGTQSRTCIDTKGCGTIVGKPVESQTCTYIASIGDPVIVGNLKYTVTDAFTTPVVGGGFIKCDMQYFLPKNELLLYHVPIFPQAILEKSELKFV